MVDRRKAQYEDEYEALNAMILNSERQFKEVAAMLFPHLPLPTAYARLKNCFNPDREERLGFGDIIRAMTYCDRYDPIYHACNVTGHELPHPITSDDIQADLIATIQGATSVLSVAMEKLNALEASRKLRAVR